jgi:hypothetical protein
MVYMLTSQLALYVSCAACELAFPYETPSSQYERVPTQALEYHRHAMKFFLGQRNNNEVAKLVKRLRLLYEAFDIQSSMCKMMLATTLLQLKAGDAIEVQIRVKSRKSPL